eukprot:1160252-Pelagomonas_calceolata.AAC.9
MHVMCPLVAVFAWEALSVCSKPKALVRIHCAESRLVAWHSYRMRFFNTASGMTNLCLSHVSPIARSIRCKGSVHSWLDG